MSNQNDLSKNPVKELLDSLDFMRLNQNGVGRAKSLVFGHHPYTASVASKSSQILTMIKTISQKNTPIEIDLTGADGNAYALLACANKLAYMVGAVGRSNGD